MSSAVFAETLKGLQQTLKELQQTMRLKPESRSFALDTFPPTLAGSSSLNVDL
jgi:hypothetical protein